MIIAILTTFKHKRGGKRPGAGRPKEEKTTKVIRVPVEIDREKLLKLYYLTEDYKGREKEASKTNVRWEAFRHFIKELE